jgi:tetratricopeptide (TPR) repeat protein
MVKWVRRRPALAASLSCVLVAVLVAFVFAYQAQRADARRRIEHEKDRLQLLDVKLRNAYLVASSGDLKGTDDAIKEIEDSGASTGQVRLLRGVVNYFRQDIKGAISELEQAVKLSPQSVAARALLAMSYADDAQLERYQQVIEEIEQLSPVTPEDYLFKGYVREQNEPGGSGLADLNEGIRRGDSPLGRALRTIALANRAIDSGLRPDAERALADANAARGMLPDSPLVLYASLYARVVAASAYQEPAPSRERTETLQDAARRTEVLEDAARDVRALEPFVGLPNPTFVTFLYFATIGDTDKAIELTRRVFERTGDPMAAMYCAGRLYRQGRFAEALKLLDQRRRAEEQGDIMRVFLLAELPDRPRPTTEEYLTFARTYSPTGLSARAKGVALLLLGRKQQAMEELRGAPAMFALSQDWKAFYKAMRQYDCGELSDDALLASAGSSRLKKCTANYEIGLFRLAEGDRAAARDHFQKAARTRALWMYIWDWSQMFLDRLQDDPKWPPWIPVKGDPQKP